MSIEKWVSTSFTFVARRMFSLILWFYQSAMDVHVWQTFNFIYYNYWLLFLLFLVIGILLFRKNVSSFIPCIFTSTKYLNIWYKMQ